MKFFNREREIKEILYIMESEPQRINFIYGPINGGKTSLINEIINNKLDKNKYVVFYIDLREIFLSRYDDFIEVLFEEYDNNDKSPTEIIKTVIQDIPSLYGIPIPKNTLNEILKKKSSKNVFRYITNVLMDIKKQGKQPILIIDELQKIGDMKINGYLIYELFNYFVSLTKHKHLCHILCLSSDSLFIEKVYNEAMLEGRCKYLLVDDFDKGISLNFMDFLAKERDIKLSNEDKELIYSYVGGKPMDINYVIEECKFKDLKEILNYLLKEETSKLKKLLIKIKNNKFEDIDYEKTINALSLFKKDYTINEYLIDEDTKEFLVKKNFLFLNPIEETLKPQSFLVWNAIKNII